MANRTRTLLIAAIAAFLNIGCTSIAEQVATQDQQRLDNMRAAPVAQTPPPAMSANWEY